MAARFWIYQRLQPTSLIYLALTAVIMVAVSASTILGGWVMSLPKEGRSTHAARARPGPAARAPRCFPAAQPRSCRKDLWPPGTSGARARLAGPAVLAQSWNAGMGITQTGAHGRPVTIRRQPRQAEPGRGHLRAGAEQQAGSRCQRTRLVMPATCRAWLLLRWSMAAAGGTSSSLTRPGRSRSSPTSRMRTLPAGSPAAW